MWMLQQADMEHVVLVDGSDMDLVSFDDSEQFEEEDSVCSWISETDQVLNWSGWRRSSPTLIEDNGEVLSLIELAAKCVAHNCPFELVEHYKPPIPESLQLRIAFWSFPNSEEEIRLYSCLACGSNDKFKLGEFLAKSGNVCDVLQIGFHMSGVVTQPVSHTPAKQIYNVAITFDRGHVTSCQCSCHENAMWCEHATAVCLYSIFNKKEISLRVPVSESLARLERDQLQKFAQYLISELPQQILPTAQRLLDELLLSKYSAINVIDGAPDPTAGASMGEKSNWVIDEVSLRENIKKILARFCGAMPLVVVDVNSAFLTSAPPVSLEWSNFIRSFQSRDPEAVWNLLSIVKHMFNRGDTNASRLLNFITEECLLCYQMMFYWISSYISLQGSNGSRNKPDNIHPPLHTSNDISRHASAHLMEEIVLMWELTVMSPHLPSKEKLDMRLKLETLNKQVIDAARKGQGQGNMNSTQNPTRKDFHGFDAAIKTCDIDWNVFYELLNISQKSPKELSIRESALKLNEATDSSIQQIYAKIFKLIPPGLDEFALINKLTQSLCCHGYVNKASKIASILASKIISTYPDKLSSGEINFASITEKANNLCEILLKDSENERVAFELAILGLTVPRLPARTNIEEVKLTYLELDLYKKLKSIVLSEEHFAFIRYQAQKLISYPMLRGDGVLPLIMATYLLEVLCAENVTSTVLQGQNVRIKTGCRLDVDEKVGYQCALVSLGLCSNAVDHKQPMLCESIRHHRRDLALALLTHCRMNEERIDEVLSVILEKGRYSFFSTNQVGNTTIWVGAQDLKNKSKGHNDKSADRSGTTKHGFTFADINNSVRSNERPPKQSSDSDSGNGDGRRQRLPMRNLPVPVVNNRKTLQQRRQTRQNTAKNVRTGRNARTDRPKHSKLPRGKKIAKSKSSRELTESDSGQEMHFSFDAESAWTVGSENWDDEVKPSHKNDSLKKEISQPKVVTLNEEKPTASYRNDIILENNVETSCTQVIKATDASSGGGSSLSSSDSFSNDHKPIITKHKTLLNDVSLQSEHHHNDELPTPDVKLPLILPEVVLPEDVVNVNIDVDAGYDDDFNIEAGIFESPDIHMLTHGSKYPFYEELTTNHSLSSTSNDKSKVENETFLTNQVDGLPLTDQLFYTAHVEEKGSLEVDDNDEIYTDADVTDVQEGICTDQSCATNSYVTINSVDTVMSKGKIISPTSELKVNSMNYVQTDMNELDSNVSVNSKFSELPLEEKQEYVQDQSNGTLSGVQEQGSNVPLDQKTSLVQEQACKVAFNQKAVCLQGEATEAALEDKVSFSQEKSGNMQEESLNQSVLRKTENQNTFNLADLTNDLQSVQGNLIFPVDIEEQPSKEVQEQQTKSRKNKQKKNRKYKQHRVAMNVHSIEAEAYSLFELAKSVLMQARNTAVFSADVDEVNTTTAINRKLQLAAFEIGLFALNLHNYSSPNWFSRTYSSYVSWIENLAVDIGTAAIRVLNERWEGVLTPSESIQTATRASRSGDALLKRTAAELALSCLPHSRSLSPGDITQTITLCREQDDDMLERACSTVESAGRNGGVQPELLFQIAREWNYLHEQKREGANENQNVRLRNRNNASPNFTRDQQQQAPVFMTPEQFVQEQMHQKAQEILGRQSHRNTTQDQFTWIYPQYLGPLHHCPLPQQAMHSRRILNIDSYGLPISNFPDELNLSEIPRYLQNSYRVGMRALEALTLRMPDDRPHVKYALAPPSSEDIRWMCALSASLGPPYLKNFCKVVNNAVTSPFLLHDLALEAARHFALYNPAQVASHLRSPSVSPIVQKALAMYTELVHHDLVLLAQPGYADFVDLLRRTRSAFCMAPGGMARFNDILEVIRKTYRKKRELWQLIMTGLSKA